MANDNFPRGLIPLNRGGGRATGRYYLASTAADLYLGQPVVIAADGRVAATATAGAGGLLILGVGGGAIDWTRAGLAADVGVVSKPYYDVSDLPGGRTGYVFVYDDPMQEYTIREDTAGTTRILLTDIGAAADMVWDGDGNTVLGSSAGFAQLRIRGASVVSTMSGAFQILELADQINTDGTQATTGNYAQWVVRITNNQRGGGIVNVAV